MRNFFFGLLIICVPSFLSAESVGGQFEAMWYDQIAKAQADPVLWEESPFGVLGIRSDADAQSLSMLLEDHSPEQALSDDNAQDNALKIRKLIDASIRAASQDVAAGKGDLKIASQLYAASKYVPWLDDKKRENTRRDYALALKHHYEAEAKRLGVSPQEAENLVRTTIAKDSFAHKLAMRPFKEKFRSAMKMLQKGDLGGKGNYHDYTGTTLIKRTEQQYQSLTLYEAKGVERPGSTEEDKTKQSFGPASGVFIYLRNPVKEAIYEFKFGLDEDANLVRIILYNLMTHQSDQVFYSREIAQETYTDETGQERRVSEKIIGPKDAMHAYSLLKGWIDFILTQAHEKESK